MAAGGIVVLLCGPGARVEAQSSTYSVAASPLPAVVGQPLTVTAMVPLTVADGTHFVVTASGPRVSVSQPPVDLFTAEGVSLNHRVSIAIPAPTIAEVLAIQLTQAVDATFESVELPALNFYHPLPLAALGTGQLNLLVAAAGQSVSPNSAFTGEYSFLFRGQTPGAAGVPTGAAAIGTFFADGKGGISNGQLFLKSVSGYNLPGNGLQGTYQIDATGRGSMQLASLDAENQPVKLGFDFFVPPGQAGVVLQNSSLIPTGGVTGSGEISMAGSFFQASAPSAEAYPVLSASTQFFDEVAGEDRFTPGAGSMAFNVTGMTGTATVHTGALATGEPDGFSGTPYLCIGCTGLGGTNVFLYSQGTGTAAGAVTELVGVFGSKPSGGVLYFLSIDPEPAANLVVGTAQY
ncbi:hypothetical protein D1Y84_10580 [Acidipila sp. EB88]|nr:hypothetical protein D1Y84_10580 [Acidipila sp. EB88]